MITIEELKQCKNATEDLIEVVRKRIGEVCSDYGEHNYLGDDFGFEYNGVCYDVIEKEKSSWDDEGKYQYQDITYQLVSFDRDIKSYPCEQSIIDKFDLFLVLVVERSGSYFSDYNYTYDKPSIQIVNIEHVSEKIIPAHDEIVFTELK